VATLPEGTRRALETFSTTLKSHFGEGLTQLLLFGSHARGGTDETSDLDVLVVVQPGLRHEARKAAAEVVSRLLCEGGLYISVVVIDRDRWQHPSPFTEEVKRDAVAL